MPRMTGSPELTLHAVPFSHPCLAVEGALKHHRYEYERVELVSGQHGDEIERIYGSGKRTVPGLLIDGEPVHGTTAIFTRLDEMVGPGSLYPTSVAATIREAERGLAEDLQTAARFLTFGALHFRPEALGTFSGSGPLDPAGTDFAIRFVRGAWKYIGIDAKQIFAILESLPDQFDQVDELIADGAAGGEEPTALDFQLGSTIQMLLQVGDLRPMVQGRPVERLAIDWFEPGLADIPAGALPARWIPLRA